LNYGRVTSLALDPIEKKPLKLFYPGSVILSAGSFGCNLACPFCQNAAISQTGPDCPAEFIAPAELAAKALLLADRGNIGVAYTYNEPLVGWEFIRDTAAIVRAQGMKNVVVTNGTAERGVLEEILPYTDAMNIDLKGFTPEWYRALGGDLETVKRTIAVCVPRCHVELTTLVIPGRNDSESEMENLARWVASVDAEIPLHITRFFPRYRMTETDQTPADTVHRLVRTARRYLNRVFPGNL